MTVKKVQLYLDRDKTIEASPETSANCVILSDGNDLQKVLDNDLTTPTVVHEETSFKVGVGDVNVSSSVVDGEVGRMVIKGKTYQNILPEPSTHVLTNNKEMFKVNEGLDPNVEIVDGVSKSAILKGSTLLNLATPVEYKTINFHGYCLIIDGSKLKSGTYTTKSSVDFSQYVLDLMSTQKDKPHYYARIQITKDGVFTIDDTFFIANGGKAEDFFFCLRPVNDVIGGVVNTNEIENVRLVLLEGDYANIDIPFFTGMQSVKMPVLTTTGANVFSDDNTMELGAWTTTGGDYVTNSEIRCKNPFTRFPKGLKNGDKMYIVLSDTSINSSTNIHVYDENKKYIRTLTWTNFVNGVVEITIGYGNDAEWKYFSFRAISNNTDCKFALMINEVYPYEPYKTNILSTPQDLELRGIGNVKDTLDLMTGDVTERVGEVVLDGSENWIVNGYTNNQSDVLSYFSFKLSSLNCILNQRGDGLSSELNNIDCASSPNSEGWQIYNGQMRVNVLKSKLSEDSVNGFKQWLSQNPITVQYKLETPVIKTVDLSSSGNWEKIVLDGSESWTYETPYLRFYTPAPNMVKTNNYLGKLFCDNPNFILTTNYSGMKDLGEMVLTGYIDANNSYPNENWIYITVKSATDVNELKQYLSQNPMTVWYQTATHQDSTQVKQPIFFKDGHIQLSSGADHSLIPTLDYQAKTSNSYVMDLMKTNTRYTMKAKSASGTFTIDGTSYGAGANGTFTTPSSMTNKLLVMSNKTNEEVMILEGDVVSKSIPYFKGIKSAFEDEDKIEVLSQGKNLVDLSKGYHFASESDVTISNNTVSIKGNNTWTRFMIPVYLKANTHYTLTYNTSNAEGQITVRIKSDGSGDSKAGSFLNTWGDGMYYVSLNTTTHVGWVHFSDIQLIEGSEGHLQYEPHKSNNTKIPLLSPLRSLPNGVCDELIIDRMKKKATLIRRLDCVTFDGSSDENWHTWGSTNSTSHLNNYHYVDGTNNTKNLKVKVDPSWIVSRLGYGGGYTSKKTGASLSSSYFAFSIPKNSIGAGSGDTDSMYEKSGRAWLSQNPITVYYELATPVVTEIDLENFPLIYKDGHIFLNSEIAPVVEIDYNVNQAQQIQANNETLQRHELDILDLDNLIVSFVNAEYNLRLLKFDMELSMMTLAE